MEKLEKFIFKGSKETRILIVNKNKKQYNYFKIGNEKLIKSNLNNFKKIKMKELESMKIKLHFRENMENLVIFNSEVPKFLKEIENKVI